MRLKYLAIFFAPLLAISGALAQTSIMLFDSFEQGKVYLHNHITTTAKLNYDAANSKMIYQLDGNEMTLMNNHEIDSIIFRDSKFIPHGNIYLEVVNESKGDIFINWKLKEKPKGYQGAMGLTTQAKVESIDLSHITTKKNEISTAEITELSNNNEYWFYQQGKLIKCRNERQLLKQFPQYRDQIREFIKQENINFKNPADAIRLINHALGL